ncbi:putative gustatory receptor 57a [Drosophila busckii]|nr:putative gustatory receptor 57a [Drosophila busckii]
MKLHSLNDSLRFICGLQFLLCCSGFYVRGSKFVSNKYTRSYSLICATLIVCGLCAAIYALLQHEQLLERVLQLDKLVLSITVLELIMSTLVFLITVLSLQRCASKHLDIYARLASIDLQLMQQFGANLHYNKMQRKNVLLISLVTLLYLGAINTALTRVAETQHLLLLLPVALLYILITGGPHLTGYVHMNLTELLSIRFRLLQQILKPQFLHTHFGHNAQLCEHRVASFADLVKQLHYIIQQINEVYNLSLWASIAHDFTLSTSELYIIFGRSISEQTDSEQSNLLFMGFLALCMLVPFYKMLIGPVYCSRSVLEGRKCLRLLEQLDNWFPRSLAIKQLVGCLMRWRLQFKIAYTSGMSLVLNKTIITLFTAIVCEYLLVLIQFAMTQKLGEQIEEQKSTLQDWIVT